LPGLAGKRAYDVFLECFHQGVLVRSAGENLVLAPAYVVEAPQIEQMVSVLAGAIKKLA
jgi:beta-alanine--pyruvate transaminase